MAAFCDVAVPVPLDAHFTYRIDASHPPPLGGRVIVPFRSEKLIGVVTRLHDEPPPVEAKAIERILDDEAILSPQLLELARWISQYYLAPLGEVLRTMLPLVAEVRRHVVYRIAEAGERALQDGAEQGSTRRTRRTPEEQAAEYAVLNYLLGGDSAKRATLMRATGASRDLIDGMVRKKWIVREAVAAPRNARRMESYAVLVEVARLPKLNENQQAILATLAGAGGTLPVAVLRGLAIPGSTLGTLVRRGLIRIEERPQAFHLSGLRAQIFALNTQQQQALESITRQFADGGFRASLLYGVTGSGKTAVYMAAMQRALDLDRSAILLVPEIGLTPATAAQLHHAFGDEVAMLHSALTPEERAEQWHRIRRGEARIVVGTRSAIFAPAVRLGLIIVDEEHDSSYKQEENPRYHARDVAVMRAKLAEAPVVLGSATPSLESWHNAERGRYALIEMPERVNQRPLPEVELVDMRQEFQETGQEQIFSRRLVAETEATLARGEQVIILLNRRGYSFVVMCRACGERLECENCAVALTHHRPIVFQDAAAVPDGELYCGDCANAILRERSVSSADAQARAGQRLECHYCGYKRTVPKLCPKCGSEHLYFLGAGSQQGEQRLQEIFPHARIGRMDRDTVRSRHDMERLLMRLHSGDINLLVGTQMIAKGHDIHGITLVGVVGADYALGLPDFRAAERVFQLLTQVSGRAGRGESPGRVVVQSYHPEHYAIQCAQAHDYRGFAAKEMKYRRWMHYPPYGVIANLLVRSSRMEEAAGWAATLGKWFQSAELPGIRVLGPATAPIAKIKRTYRFHLVLKAERRDALSRALHAARAFADQAGIPRSGLVFDMDAISLM
ncbi:MAG TPA: primosomal protein N' [Acidobacteriaceae bacterium]|jgi:primosomal protein N' (replication factor Y)